MIFVHMPLTAEIIAFEGPHFVLTPRARGSLKENPYPDPRRMKDFVVRLERLARFYHEVGGRLGRRLEDVAISETEIEVALFDSSLTAPAIELDGTTYFAMPHVKVDDNKSPDRCGRIYFAVDATNARFIVDHIGLHNYS